MPNVAGVLLSHIDNMLPLTCVNTVQECEMTTPPRLSKYFHEPIDERKRRDPPLPRGAFDVDNVQPVPPRETFPFLSHRTLAEAWRWHRKWDAKYGSI